MLGEGGNGVVCCARPGLQDGAAVTRVAPEEEARSYDGAHYGVPGDEACYARWSEVAGLRARERGARRQAAVGGGERRSERLTRTSRHALSSCKEGEWSRQLELRW